MLKKIASFTINHDTLTPGMYVSRIDGDCVTYDLRLKFPNQGDYVAQSALHTLEHLIATFVRSSTASEQVVYFGPMGCRTGASSCSCPVRTERSAHLPSEQTDALS